MDELESVFGTGHFLSHARQLSSKGETRLILLTVPSSFSALPLDLS